MKKTSQKKNAGGSRRVGREKSFSLPPLLASNTAQEVHKNVGTELGATLHQKIYIRHLRKVYGAR